MKLLKSGVFIVLFLVVISSIVLADFLEINLTKSDITTEQNFEGYIKLRLDNPIPKDSFLSFLVDNSEVYTINLYDVLADKNIQVLPKSYEKIKSPSLSSKELVFNAPGSKVELGIDFASAASQVDTIGELATFTIAFSGSPIGQSYPTLTMNIGNDNSIDYTFKGSLTGQFEDQDSSYLADNIPDLTKGIRPFQDTYCQEINLKPSSKYKILATVKKLSEGALLQATIAESPLESLTCDETQKCCNLNPTSANSEVSCDLDLEINEQDNYYVCIAATTGLEDTEKEYYQISADNDIKKVRGYYNGRKSPALDFFIKVKRALFETRITTPTGDKEIPKESITNYLATPGCDNSCLLIPVNITSMTPGKLVLSNLKLNYVDTESGPTSINSFVPISYLPERINIAGKTQVIPLSFFGDLFAPSAAKKDYTLSMQLETSKQILLTSNTLKFNTVVGPTAHIGLNTLTAGIGEEIAFTAYGAKSEEGRTIISYEWNFGDNKTARGSQVKHAYITNGTFFITLTINDSAGYIGKSKAQIEISQTTTGFGKQVEEILTLITSAKSNLENSNTQVKDTASLLGIPELLNHIESNVTTLNDTLNKILASNKPNTEKTNLQASTINQITELKNKIPQGIIVSLATFTSKVMDINQIPNEVALSDELKAKVLKAQQSVSVSGEARIIEINYGTTTKEITLIKKIITSGSGEIYEILPVGSTIDQVLTPDYISVTPDRIFKLSEAASFIYTLEGSSLDTAFKTKTIVVPKDVEDIEIPAVEDEKEITAEIKIGSNLPMIILAIATPILIGLIIYFGLFFKGGFLNKKPAKSFFKNIKDYLAVKNFVQQSLKKGLKEENIKLALKSKGWKDEQINAVLKEFKEEKEKAKKEAEKKLKQNKKYI